MSLLSIRMPFACLFVMLIVLIYYLRRKNLPSMVTSVFNLLISVSIIHVVSEIITEYTVCNRDIVPDVINEVLHIIFELTVVWVSFLLHIHIVSSIALRKNVRVNKEILAMFIANAVFSIGIIVSPIDYVDTEFGSYARGVKTYFLYAGVVFFLAGMVIYLVKNKKYVDGQQYFGLKVAGIVTLLLTAVQITLPYILMTGLVMTTVILNLYLGLENPDAYYNDEMNMFNESGFRRVLLERLLAGRKQEILAIAIKPRTKDDREYIKKQALHLKKLMSRKYNMDAFALTDRLLMFISVDVIMRAENAGKVNPDELNAFGEHVDIHFETISCTPDKASFDNAIDHIEDMKMRFSNEEIYIDSMTGVFNRNRYESDMAYIKENESGCYVAFIDINGLKYVNDHFGHDTGDKLIVETGRILLKAFSGLGQIYRVGGDEFTVIYFGALPIENVLESAKAAAETRGNELDIPISFAAGYAYSDSGSELDKAIKTADINMYEDKQKSEFHR